MVERHEIDGSTPLIHCLPNELLAAAVTAKVVVGIKTGDGVAVLSCSIVPALLSSLDGNHPLPLICARRGKRSITRTKYFAKEVEHPKGGMDTPLRSKAFVLEV